MATPSDLTSDLEFTTEECATLHGTFVSDADTVEDRPDAIAEEQIAGECVFDSRRHRLVGELFHLLYSENVERDNAQPRVLVLHVVQDSPTTVDQTFEVLKFGAMTKWGTTGFYQDNTEDTQIFEILFYDNATGDVSQRILNAAEEAGELLSPSTPAVDADRAGEFVQLARIEDVEGTTITPPETESSFPSETAKRRLDDVFPLPGRRQ